MTSVLQVDIGRVRPLALNRRSAGLLRSFARRRRSGCSLLAGLLVSAAACACGSQAPAPRVSSPAQLSASQLLQKALHDARADGSVHEVMRGKDAGSAVTFSDDVSLHGGRQKITLTTGNVAHVLVDRDVAYISGDGLVMRRYFGFSAPAAAKIGSRWLSIPSTNRAFAGVADDVTLGSAIRDLALVGHLTELVPSRLNGRPVVGILGTASLPGAPRGSVAGTVYVTRSGTPLPVAATYSSGTRASTRIVLDRWGEGVRLRAPTHVITVTALRQAFSGSSQRSNQAATASGTSTPSGDDAWVGYWVATGRVLQAHDSAVQTRGEIIERLWLIHRACAGSRCPLELERQTAGSTANTLGSPITAPLTGTSNRWHANFVEPNVYCLGAGADYPGTERSNWKITQASPGTITALETTRTSGPDCEIGTSTIVWTAHRLSRSQTHPA